MILIKIKMDIDYDSAFDSEVISLLVAHEVAGDCAISIWSDGESSIKRLSSHYLGALAQSLSG